MIKAETKGNSIEMTIKGKTEDIVTESINVIKKVSMELAEIIDGKITNESIENTLFGILMTTIENLNDEGYNIDSRHIGVSMIALHDVDTKEIEELGRKFFED